MAIDPSTAFVSYSREDLDFVVRLAKDVKEKGAKLWVDRVDIRPGQRWEAEIEVAVDACSRMLVVLSPAAIASKNVLAEASLAIDDGKEVIPVLYRDCKVPFRLRPLQYADFRTDYATGLAELLAVLTSESEVTPVVTAEHARLDEESHQAAAEQARLEDEHKQAEAEKARQEQLERERQAAGEIARQEEIERQRVAEEQARLEAVSRQAEAEKVRQEQLELERIAAEEKARRDELERQRVAAEQARLKQERKHAETEKARLEEEERQRMLAEMDVLAAERKKAREAEIAFEQHEHVKVPEVVVQADAAMPIIAKEPQAFEQLELQPSPSTAESSVFGGPMIAVIIFAVVAVGIVIWIISASSSNSSRSASSTPTQYSQPQSSSPAPGGSPQATQPQASSRAEIARNNPKSTTIPAGVGGEKREANIKQKTEAASSKTEIPTAPHNEAVGQRRNPVLENQGGTEVDPVTKRLAGTWEHGGYGYHEVIAFFEDGTFTRRAAGTGPIMTGTVNCKGAYRLEQGILVMRVPGNGDVCNVLETYNFRFISSNQLYLKGVGQSIMDDTFVRVK